MSLAFEDTSHTAATTVPIPPGGDPTALNSALQSKFRELFDSATDPLLLVDSGGTIRMANREAEQLLHYPPDRLLGKHCHSLLPERDHGKFNEHLQWMLIRRKKFRFEKGQIAYCIARSGREIPVDISVSPSRESGELFLVVHLRDMQHQEKEKQRLQAARKQADHANRTKSRFLAAASHDLRQPLQAISMYLGLLAGNLGGKEKASTIEKTRMSLTTIQHLLDSLLEISKLESGKVSLDMDHFAVSKVLASVYNTGKPLAERKKHKFRLQTCSAIVYTDARLLEQLLGNLVSNAIRYTPEGGHIVLGCRRRKNELEIQVADNGIGIPSEQLDNVFNEYVQLDNKGRRSDAGLGLGLAIVKLIAEQLKLSLDIRSTPGKGCTFCVRLPLVRQRHEDRLPPPRQTASPRFKATVLLIEDDMAVQDSTRLFLETSGLKVITAESSREALVLVSKLEQAPDLIISDYNLQIGENGIKAIQGLRARLRNSRLPALLITGDVSERRSSQALKAGCHLIRKPIEAGKLLQSIAALLPEFSSPT